MSASGKEVTKVGAALTLLLHVTTAALPGTVLRQLSSAVSAMECAVAADGAERVTATSYGSSAIGKEKCA